MISDNTWGLVLFRFFNTISLNKKKKVGFVHMKNISLVTSRNILNKYKQRTHAHSLYIYKSIYEYMHFVCILYCQQKEVGYLLLAGNEESFGDKSTTGIRRNNNNFLQVQNKCNNNIYFHPAVIRYQAELQQLAPNYAKKRLKIVGQHKLIMKKIHICHVEQDR